MSEITKELYKQYCAQRKALEKSIATVDELRNTRKKKRDMRRKKFVRRRDMHREKKSMEILIYKRLGMQIKSRI